MNLKKFTLGFAALALAFAPAAMAQQAESGSPKAADLTVSNYRMGLAQKLRLSDAELKAMGEVCTPYGLPTIKQTMAAVKAGKAALSKSRKTQSTVAPVSRASYTSTDTLLWESFESWDGQTFNFTPDGWTEFSVSDDAINVEYGYNPTWATYQTDGYYSPYATDGNYVGMLSYSYDIYNEAGNIIQAAADQDEWLVSPKTSVAASNYLSFDLGYSPISMHYFMNGEDYDIDFERKSFDLEVLVTTSRRLDNNPENYTSVFKLSDAIAKEIAEAGTDSVSITRLMSFTWHHFCISLKEFDGQNISVAFRYTGKNGGTVLLDAVRISDLLPVAKYVVPSGSFFYGFSQEHYVAGQGQASVVLLPADRENVWTNISNADSRSYEWLTYEENDDMNTPTGAKYTDTDLVMPAHNASQLIYMPVLTAKGEANTNDFTKTGMFKFGGNSLMMYGETAVLHGAGNYDLTKGYWTAPLDDSGQRYLFGTGSGAFWTQYSDQLTGKVTGVANWYDAPASPYIITRIWLPLAKFNALNSNLSFNCTIYKVETDENGTLVVTDEVIANTSTTAKAVSENQVNGSYNMVFDFAEQVIIDQPVMIYIDGFQQNNVLMIAPLAQALGHDSGVNYALISLETKNKSYEMLSLENVITNPDGNGNAATAFCISSNAVFPYLYSLNGYAYAAPDQGGEVTFECDSYFSPEEWTVEGLPAWAKMEKVIDETSMTVKVKFTVDAIPSDVEGRTANVKITSVCNDMTFTLLQGADATGIEGVDASKSVMARLADNTLQLDYTAGITSVAVYNTSGVLVKSATLPASGSATLDASDLGRGTYIVRFGGSSHPVVKVVK